MADNSARPKNVIAEQLSNPSTDANGFLVMNDQEIGALRKIIQDRTDRCIDRIAAHSLDVRARNEDRGSAKLVIVEQCELELSKLQKSKAWLESKNAGLCYVCQSDIAFERLRENYETRLCDHCAKNLTGEKQ